MVLSVNDGELTHSRGLNLSLTQISGAITAESKVTRLKRQGWGLAAGSCSATIISMSRINDDDSFFAQERDRLAAEITSVRQPSAHHRFRGHCAHSSIFGPRRLGFRRTPFLDECSKPPSRRGLLDVRGVRNRR